MSGGKPTDALCLCEYDDVEGQRQHLMAACCDCEALDIACDRFITCRKVPPEITERLFTTIEDRCRIPWRGGAIRVRPDVMFPIILVPCSILLASVGPVWTVVSFAGTFLFLLTFYRLWRRHQLGRQRTRIFFVFGVTSISTMYYTFLSMVVTYRELLLWEVLLLSLLLAAMVYYVARARRDPGIIRPESEMRPSRRRFYSVSEDHSSLSELEVVWVDSRPIRSTSAFLLIFGLSNALVAFSALMLLVRRQEGHPACKKWGWWRWALVSPDRVVAPSRMVCVSASVNLRLHHKLQKFSSGTGSSGWFQRKGP